MKEYLVDTNIIIYHLSGDQTATKFIVENLGRMHISFITYIEVLSYNFQTKDEEMAVRDFIGCLNLLGNNKDIIEKSIELRKIKKLKLPDCIIAATAKSRDLILVTKNEKDFINRGFEVLNLYNISDNL